jgi:hypothetical protein
MLRTPLIRSAFALAGLAVLALVGWMSGGDGTGYRFGTGDAAVSAEALDAIDALDIDAVDTADLPVDFEDALDELVADGLGLPGNEAGNSYEEAIHGTDTYGDDAQLDALWDACADGDLAACDELYLDSPIGSAYEAFGDSCGGRQFEDTGVWCAAD